MRENEKREERDTPPLNPHIIVMPRGDRDLAVVTLKERLSLSAVADIMRQIARALEYLHSKGIVHADVKLLVRTSKPRLFLGSRARSRAESPSLLRRLEAD